MRCFNCNSELPKDAKACPRCEAPVMDEPSEEEMETVAELLGDLPPEVAADLREVFLESATAEEFADRILVGDCPRCDSQNTSHCEYDPEIAELLVGRCYDCGQLWCTECRRLLERSSPVCPCWEEDVPEEDEGGPEAGPE
ncbi:MAG TPA: hypothetical protein VK395_31845 [Gemmataceae bacterium]|nr:hypothetical protein [Gemmataceae bacterium]